MAGVNRLLIIAAYCMALVNTLVVVDFNGAVDYDAVVHLASLVGPELELTHVMFFNTTSKAMIEKQLASVGLNDMFFGQDYFPQDDTTSSVSKRSNGVDCRGGKLIIRQSNISKWKAAICTPLASAVFAGSGIGAVIVKHIVCADAANGHETSICSLGVLFAVNFLGGTTAFEIAGLCEMALEKTWIECDKGHGGTAAVQVRHEVGYVDSVEYETVRDCENDDLKAKECRTVEIHNLE